MPPHFVCSGDGTRQIVILKTKIKPVSIKATAKYDEDILYKYDLMMNCLSNVHDRITLIICRQMNSCKTFPHIFGFHYQHIFFCICHERNLVWNLYGSMEDCLPFHFILASFIIHTEISVPFHSIPCPASVHAGCFCGKFAEKARLCFFRSFSQKI